MAIIISLHLDETLLLSRSTHRAGLSAAPAVNADVGIDDVLAVTLGDGRHGASGSASTTAHASVADHIGHWLHLQSLV